MPQMAPDFLAAPTPSAGPPAGMVKHIVTVQPATGFEYHYYSSTGVARVIHLGQGALEAHLEDETEVLAFRAGVSPIEKPMRGGFFTSPDSVKLRAEAHIFIESGDSGDSIVCRSFGSWNGLKVTLTIYRENSDGSVGQILQEDIQDADEHTFPIP